MTLRDQRQLELANAWINSSEFGIVDACPRFGKIRMSINILRIKKYEKILIAYPDKSIRSSWEEEFIKCEYSNTDIVFTTHISLKKHVDEVYNLVILDEIHLLSPAQVLAAKDLLKKNKKVLGLTGTLPKWHERYFKDNLKLPTVAHYSISQGIEEEIITDYDITVVTIPLEKEADKRFTSLSSLIHYQEEKHQDTKIARLARVNIIKKSKAKLSLTKHLLKKHENERILVFSGLIDVADSLGIPSYHSRTEEVQIFEDFAVGIGNQLSVCKLGNSGITYKPLNRVIINYFDSNSQNLTQKINRCMGLEYDNPDKKAYIYIVSSNEEVELQWLRKALEFFDKTKINLINLVSL